MALISCPECQHQVSDTAQSCPNCGFPLQSVQTTQPPPPLNPVSSINPKPQKKSSGCLWLVGIGVVILIFASLCNDSDSSSPSPSSYTPQEKKWYAGGTLHTKRLSDWRVASFDNKLATCADWAANIKIKKGENYNGDLTSMRADALMIFSCIDEVAKDPKIEMPLVDIVASCAVLMKLY